MITPGRFMRAAVIDAPRTASLQQTTIPEPGRGQVRVRLEGCGVCGSNLAIWHGQPWFSYPLAIGAPGHEGWGVIDAIGDAVDGLATGSRVAFLSSHAFAEYDLAAADAVVPLPRAMDGTPFPGEALACAVNVVARARITPGEVVAVVGVGFLGALIVRLAANAGGRVLAISRRPFALEMARLSGAASMLLLTDHDDTAARVMTLTDGQGAACSIEAAGTQASLDIAATITATRGRLVIAGYHQDGPRQVDMQSWNWRGIDVINAHERDTGTYVNGIRAAVDAVSRGDLDPLPLYTHTVGLGDLDRGLDLLVGRPDGFMKALVMT
jgi:threonine dehydrogenase-like Zn-dependent dehydrogenase